MSRSAAPVREHAPSAEPPDARDPDAPAPPTAPSAPADPSPPATPAPAEALPSAKPRRADARRNFETLVRTAATLFDQQGADVALDEVARRAGVGIGTLYRHFPTRGALVEAVYRREVEVLCAGVEDSLASGPADVALAEWMRAFALYVARKRGMASALKELLGTDSTVFAECRERILAGVATLLDAAVAEGSVRADIDPDDLLRAMGGICMATDTPGWTDRTARLVALLMDGLRFGAANQRPVGADVG